MADPSKVALKGSCKIVTDYFEFAINSILFQRGIYPAEDFQTVRKYDLPLLVNVDDDVKEYIQKIMEQIKKWIYGKKIVKLVLVIVSKTTVETVERWEFNININDGDDTPQSKSRDETKKEIQAIIRQITSSVSYLPLLKDDDYTFNVMVYTDPNNPANVPIEWLDTNGDQKMLEGDVEQVNFTSFSTDVHRVGTVVSYKVD